MNKRWKTCLIGDLIARGEAELKTGPFGTQLHASDYVSQGIPVINVRNIGFGDLKEEKLEFLSEETAQRLSSHLLEVNDIVFGRKGAVERHAFISHKYNGWFQGSDCLRLRFKTPSIDARFISYFFCTETHKRWMVNQCSHGSTMASLNQEIIGRIPLYLPPLPIQRKIAEILSAYDDLIENNRRRIAILEEMAHALYQEWFVKFRFPGHEQVPLVESELGMIPQGWGISTFSQVASFINGFAFEPKHWGTTGKPIIKIAELKNGITDKTPYYEGDDIASKYHIQNGDLLFSWSADLDVYIWYLGDSFLNQHIFKVIPNRGFSKSFLFYSLKEHMWEFRSKSQGTTMRHIKRSALDEVKLLIPHEKIRQGFEYHVEPILLEVQKLTQKNTNLRRARDLLLPRLISGEIDVSSWVAGETGDEALAVMAAPVAQRVVRESPPIEPIDTSKLERRSLWE